MKRILLALSALLLVGCGAREEIVISKLDFEQKHWDSLEVSITFARRTVLSKDQPVSADSLYIVAYNAAYDTLYAGNDPTFYIADANLGSRERILLEVCGQVKIIQLCEQIGKEASPKRVRIDQPEFAYPYLNRVYQGSYKLPFIVERQAFGSTDEGRWEKVTRTKPIEGFIRAFVTGKEDESVHFPFTKTQAPFNLTHHPNYKDFKYYLDSALLDFNQANVQFDIFVDIGGITNTVASVTREIALKTSEEQQIEVAGLSKLAAEQLVELLNPRRRLRDRKNVVYINTWTYNRFKRMYSIEVDIEWGDNRFYRDEYSISGVLDVYEKDLRSSFRMVDINRRAERLWDDVAEGSILPLKPLDTYQNDQQEDIRPPSENLFTLDDGTVLIEAENFHGTRSRNNLRWRVERNQRGFEGEGAVVVLPDRGIRVRNRYTRESPSLEYKIMFTRPGTYYVWLRAWAKDDNSNSVHLGLDGDDISTLRDFDIDRHRQWTWSRDLISQRGYARFDVRSPGIHTLNLWMREDGVYIDRIIVTQNRYLIPDEVENERNNSRSNERNSIRDRSEDNLDF